MLKQTPLHDIHIQLGAKMVDFAGWHMPLQYYDGILAEHRAVRETAGMFDASHMGELDFEGKKAEEAVQQLITNNVHQLVDGSALYSVVCNSNGGIVDDCIVYRFHSEHFRIVVNASNVAKDEQFFREHLLTGCRLINRSHELALIAVQGPQAVNIIAQCFGSHLSHVKSFHIDEGSIANTSITAARTGYTGEDGFELFVPANQAIDVWQLLARKGVAPCGLGARDTLRLEARLCLYGNDIDETTSPFEAGLDWVVCLDKPEFIGQSALRDLKKMGITRKLVGFRVEDRGIVRRGAEVLDQTGTVVGTVTSGGVSPSVGGAIGLAYVPISMSAPGTIITLQQRGKQFTATLVKGPFYRRAL